MRFGKMSKQELIDKAVHALKGKWPNVFNMPTKRTAIDGFYITNCGTITHKDRCEWFKECEFQQRARELGYINGYRWGVEYQTNGKKPDLPDTILVDVRSNRMKDWHIKSPQEVGGWLWRDLGSDLFFEFFRIVDKRYKPADTSYLDSVSEIPESKSNAENVSDWYDYEAQKAVALPPVGEKVEVFLHWSESWSGWVVIVGHDHDGVIWRNGSYIYSPKDEIRPLDNATRKAEAEKKRVVDAAYDEAIKAGCVDFGQWLSVIYDAGFLRMPAE